MAKRRIITASYPADKLIRVLRPHDLLHLQIQLRGFDFLPASWRRPPRIKPAKDPVISLIFDPQHVEEQVHVFKNAVPDAPASSLRYASAVSSRSRLDFAVLTKEEIALSLDDILACCGDVKRARQVVTPAAKLPQTADDAAQLTYERILYPQDDLPSTTAIELPRHLVLQPVPEKKNGDVTWQLSAGKSSPVSGVPVWQARLLDGAVTVINRRATSDFPCDGDGQEECHALTPVNQRKIVQATVPTYRPQPVRKLMLGSLGASLDLEAAYQSPGVDLRRWVHRTTSGRDQYVKVDRLGFLYPIGIRAIYLEETDRRLRFNQALPVEKAPVSLLEKRYYVELFECRKDYALDPSVSELPEIGGGTLDEEVAVDHLVRRRFVASVVPTGDLPFCDRQSESANPASSYVLTHPLVTPLAGAFTAAAC